MTRFCTCPGSLAFSLESSRKRNQLAEASCNTCGGRFLVDGLGPISRSMLGTVGLEVTNSINPELSWKTVTKGKRSRKSVARTNGLVALGSKSPKRVGDFSGSDSDKFGEAGIGQCVPDKAEYVPIKKRRRYFRSPSPSSRTSLYGGESVSPQLHTSSSHSDDAEHLSDHNGSSGSYTNRLIAARVGNGVNDEVVKVSEVTGGELYNSDNFSGIALLAAAACINNVEDDPYDGKGDAMEVSSAPQRSDASTSSLPVREGIPCSESGKQMDGDDNKGCSLVVEGSGGAPSSDENEEGKSVGSKVDRRHWDLNTFMDAWEQPNDDTSDQFNCVDASIDGMQMVKLDKGCGIQRDARSNGNDAESWPPVEQIESAIQSSTTKMKENESEGFCNDMSSTKETSPSSLNGHSLEPLKFSPADTKVSSHVLSSNDTINNFPLCESYHSPEVSGGNVDTKSHSVSTIIHGEDSCRDASSLPNISEQNVFLTEASDLEKFGGENDGQLRDAEDSEKISELPDNKIALRDDNCIDICKTLDAENLESISEDNSLPSSKCEGLSISDISVGGHSTLISGVNGQDEKVLAANALGIDAGRHSGSKQGLSKHEDSHVCNGEAEGRSILQDTCNGFALDDCHNSDVSQDDPGHVDGKGTMDELQVDYDSPYEDGELRGSVLYSWEGDELEDGENECLDYESDGRGGEDSDACEYPRSKVVEAGSEGSQGIEKRSSLAIQVREAGSKESSSLKSSLRGDSKENREKIETAGKKVSNQGSGTTEELSIDVIVERNDGLRRGHTSDHMDGLDVNIEGSYVEEVGLKTTRGKLQSRIEGPSSSDAMERDNVYTQWSRSRNNGNSYSREERDGSPDRYVTRYRSAVYERERNGGDSQLVYWDSRNRYSSSYRGPKGHGPTRQRSCIADSVDKFGGLTSHDPKQSINYSSRSERDSSPDRFAARYRSAVERERIGGDGQLFYWDSRNRHPSSYRGPEGQGQTRPRSAIADSVDKFGGLNSHEHKQSVNYASKSMQRPLGWRRSPIDRDDYHGGQRRMAGFSSNRIRGGSRNFSDGVGRGLREEYDQPLNDDAPSSVRMPHYLSWKERTFLSPSTRGAHVSVPRRNSRSRSRTRSPRVWQPQKERNLGTRRHSRSPDFRSEARMDRLRAPLPKPSFAADYGESFMSPPRGRFSPQRNFRGVDDRNFVDSHLRHRRSPLNVFRQSQRLDSIGLSGRLKSDDSFRPMMRPGRFPPVAGVGRGCKLEENNDDKRHDDRSGMMH